MGNEIETPLTSVWDITISHNTSKPSNALKAHGVCGILNSKFNIHQYIEFILDVVYALLVNKR